MFSLAKSSIQIGIGMSSKKRHYCLISRSFLMAISLRLEKRFIDLLFLLGQSAYISSIFPLCDICLFSFLPYFLQGINLSGNDFFRFRRKRELIVVSVGNDSE